MRTCKLNRMIKLNSQSRIQRILPNLQYRTLWTGQTQTKTTRIKIQMHSDIINHGRFRIEYLIPHKHHGHHHHQSEWELASAHLHNSWWKGYFEIGRTFQGQEDVN